MVGLRRPKTIFASAKANAWRKAPRKADFNRHEKANAWHGARRMNSPSRDLRPAVGLRRPKTIFASAKANAWRKAPRKADFNRHEKANAWHGA
ncbi:hypothetical protein, partial [Thermoflexus hugenholtzii]